MPRVLRMRRLLAAVVVGLVGVVTLASARAADRVALLMGNSAYQGADALPNNQNDVEAMTAVLTELGFQVTARTDLGLAEMVRTLEAFGKRVKAMSDGIAIVYFTGHGIYHGGYNHLIPVGEQLTEEETVANHTVSAESIVDLLGKRSGVVKLLVLDACRVNPFVKSLGIKAPGGGSGGLGDLAKMPPSGTLVAFAAARGYPAYPGPENGKSLFTAALVEALRRPNLQLTNVLGVASELVTQRTSDKKVPQVPWVEGPLSSRPIVLNARSELDPQAQEIAKLKAENQALRAQQPIPSQVAAVTPPPAPPAPVQPPAVTPAVGVSFPPGKVFKDCAKCPEMVVVPKGEFVMGSPDNEPDRDEDEGPQHPVTIGRDFAVGKVEVTFAEWDACVAGGGCKGYKPSDKGWGRDRHPVIHVNWEDAQSYVAWLKQQTGQPYRLLTEAEWEYAARAGTTTPFSMGQTITPEQANVDGNYTYNSSSKGIYRQRTVDVGSFKPNAFGLYDMHGNVLEWVEDCYANSYAKAPKDGTAFTASGCERRVLRGGSWDSYPGYFRSANRSWNSPGNRYYLSGFRVARTFF